MSKRTNWSFWALKGLEKNIRNESCFLHLLSIVVFFIFLYIFKWFFLYILLLIRSNLNSYVSVVISASFLLMKSLSFTLIARAVTFHNFLFECVDFCLLWIRLIFYTYFIQNSTRKNNKVRKGLFRDFIFLMQMFSPAGDVGLDSFYTGCLLTFNVGGLAQRSDVNASNDVNCRVYGRVPGLIMNCTDETMR